MKNQFVIMLVVMVIGISSCDRDEKDIIKNNGILKGTIGLYEGNCMPGPGVPACQPSPISTTVAVTMPSENFDIRLLVDSIITSDNGTFEISLAEGNYSLFLRDGNDFICDSWTCPSDCYCSLFVIKNDSTTIINANIDHAVW